MYYLYRNNNSIAHSIRKIIGKHKSRKLKDNKQTKTPGGTRLAGSRSSIGTWTLYFNHKYGYKRGNSVQRAVRGSVG